MATTSFTKNFKITKRESDAFVDIMTSRPKPLIVEDFKSNFRHVADRKEKFEKAFNK